MSITQKAMIVTVGPDGPDGLDALNIELERGWTVANVAPMGGAGGATQTPVVAALVVLEHEEQTDMKPEIATQAMEQVQDPSDEVVDEVVDDIDDVVEGDGI